MEIIELSLFFFIGMNNCKNFKNLIKIYVVFGKNNYIL